MSEKIVYVGKDLEAMSFAIKYHKWILDEFRPFLGKKIVEVGAGTGSFSELLLDEKPETIDLIEPSEMFNFLKENISQIRTSANVNFHHSIFADARSNIANTSNPDSIIYVNVLEHIEDDEAELSMIYETLKPDGRAFIFVPALQALYGEFDRKIGHFRRYKKNDIEKKCKAAGFKILKSTYFDILGIFPWWVKYKLLKSSTLESNAVELYDKMVVPITSKIENFLPVPIGKNLLVIIEK